MHVAYLINQYPGLSHSFIRREIQALERQGVRVDRYAVRPHDQGELSPEDEAEEVRTRTLLAEPKGRLLRDAAATLLTRPAQAFGALGTAMRLGRRSESGTARHVAYWVEALVLAAWLKRDGARHLHAHFGTNSATVALLASRLAGLPYSVTVHGPEEFDKPTLIGLPEKIEGAAFTAGVSSFGVSQLRRLVEPAAWTRIAEVRCGIEPDFYAPGGAGGAAEPSDFLCVGRLCEQKGQIGLVEATARLVAEGHDPRVHLIGDGEMRGAIESAIERHGLQNNVRLLGWRAPSAVRAALEATRCFVLPSYAEGLPVSIMEAFTLGKPVISTYVAGIPELVRPGENGWLVPAADSGALADAMAEALGAASETMEAFGEAGRKRAIERHDIDAQAAVLKRLFGAAA